MFCLPDFPTYAGLRTTKNTYSNNKLNVTVCNDNLLIGLEKGLSSGVSILPNELDSLISGDS
ncbi:MAG: hypothetical protein JWR54_3546, partial [Mucilaginibacter sp.]|nr:hypothetical protein [Mucilaginibacter sp.]